MVVNHPDFILSKEYHLNGIWNIYDNDKNYSYSGILDLASNEIRLKLFVESQIDFITQKWDVIHGKLLTGESITLVNCFYTGGPNDTRDIICNYVVSGKKHFKADELFFEKIYMEYEEHRAWLLSKSENIDVKQYNKVIIEKQKNKTFFDIKINDKLNIAMKYKLSYSLNYYKKSEFNEHYYFIITNKNKFSINDAITKYRFNWKMLLSMFVGQACNIRSIFLQINDEISNLYYCDFFYKTNLDTLIPNWMFMPYYSVEKHIKKILRYWFKRISKQDNYTRELFFTGFDTISKPNQESFLALIKAIEGISTKLTVSTYLDQTQFDNLKNVVKDFLEKEVKLKSDSKRKILKKLTGINEKKSLTDKVQNFIKSKFSSSVKTKLKLTDKYIEKICDIRNTLSHNKGIHYFYVFKDFNNFVKMNFILVAMLMYYYSIEMGISEKEVFDGLFKRYFLVRKVLLIK